ncbi:ribonucleotide reductase of class Ia (aerobic), beta subunit [Providencia phage PSTCR6]|nr:ribonucleotide reductase of class Ia (aerobic), beta subunit [Providencia phage PSTCR6]
MSTIFNTNQIDIMEQPMFFGESTGIARYEVVKHRVFEDLIEKQLSFFWRPEEVNLVTDRAQYDKLSEHEKRIFTNNLKYQTLLDSIQGRAPASILTNICSDVSLETWIQTWTFSETIHSRSYTHIMRNLYDDPSKEFDEIVLDDAIMARAASISKYYDDLADAVREYENAKAVLAEEEAKDSRLEFHMNGVWARLEKALDTAMRKLYLCMHAINALEAIRFYVSFACTFNFFENQGILEGNTKIMKLIARDEQLHLKGTQYMLRQWQSGKEGEHWKRIAEELREEATKLFLEVNQQEKDWVDDLFKFGTTPGLNHELLKGYADYMTNIRMTHVGLISPFKDAKNPLKWMSKYLNSDGVQAAPQEVEVDSYLISQIDEDISPEVLNTYRKYL